MKLSEWITAANELRKEHGDGVLVFDTEGEVPIPDYNLDDPDEPAWVIDIPL